MATILRALIIEDSEDDAALLLQELKRGGYAVTHERADTVVALTAALDSQPWDIAFADYSMPQFNGLTALKLVRDRGFDFPFIFVSGTMGEDTAVGAMKAGANDYVTKNNLKRLLPAVARELREAEGRLAHMQTDYLVQHMAYHDPLTDLPNRNWIDDRTFDAIRVARTENRRVALLLMDLDRFKDINDTLGHHYGDLLLKQVGVRLKGVVPDSDLVARLGGDEFAILLPRLASAADVHVLVNDLLIALEAPFVIEGLPVAVEASIGIALYPDHGADPNTLLQRADVAMYAAKKSGGYVVYDAQYDRHSPRLLKLLGELRHAIEVKQMRLHYQPKIDMATSRVTGVEALARWQHPEHGLIPPAEFIPTAEQTWLIKPLTLWIVDEALRQCTAWHRMGVPLTMAVNLSARSLHDPTLVEQIAGLIGAHQVLPSLVTLEITESAIMADPQRAKEVLAALRAIGVRLSLDDFGTGYSSLSYLKQLPMDELKIDRAFIMDATKDSHGAAIVRAVIELGHSFGLRVVAEGVEDQQVWNKLAALGCDEAQGYYVSPPLAADALIRWVSESAWGLGHGRDKTRAA